MNCLRCEIFLGCLRRSAVWRMGMDGALMGFEQEAVSELYASVWGNRSTMQREFTRGAHGEQFVLKVLVDDNRAIVEGVHMVSKSTKPSAKNPQGGIIKQEAPIHISNLSLIDPKSGKATRVAIKHEGKNVVRIAKKSGEEIK